MFGGVFATGVLTLAFGSVPGWPAMGGYTNQDFTGAFGFFGTASVVVSPGITPVGPVARVGWLTADRSGNLTFNSTANLARFVSPFDFAGNYDMESDTARLRLENPIKLEVTFVGVLSDGGNEIWDLFVDSAGIVIFANGRKQKLTGCTNGNLSGPCQIEFSGSTLHTGASRSPFAALGRIDADGAGRIAGRLTSDYGGIPLRENISGTYTTETDCTLQLTYYTADEGRTSSNGVELMGAVIDGGAGTHLMVLGPPSGVVNGSLKPQ